MHEALHEVDDADCAVVVRKLALAQRLSVLDPDRPGRLERLTELSDTSPERFWREGAEDLKVV